MATTFTHDTEALRRARWVADHYGLNLSKSTMRTFRRCPKAYRLEKVDRVPGVSTPTLAQVRGTAVHAAIEAALSQPDMDPEACAETVLAGYPELEGEAELPLAWACFGVTYVTAEGGTVTVLEDFAKLDRSHSAGFTLWARLDVVIEGGRLGGVEVVDFKTGVMCPTPATVRVDAEAGIHRLIIGGSTPLRPVHITQLHLPTATPVTVQLTDDEVLAAWEDVVDARDAIRRALHTGDFSATPGPHCAGCPYRDGCWEAQA